MEVRENSLNVNIHFQWPFRALFMTHLFILSSHSSLRIRLPYRLFTLAKSHLNMPPLSICRCQKNESSSFLALFSLRFLCFFKKRIALSAECVSVRQRCCVCARLLSSCSILCPGNCFQHFTNTSQIPAGFTVSISN